jgi:hypothetical protein
MFSDSWHCSFKWALIKCSFNIKDAQSAVSLCYAEFLMHVTTLWSQVPDWLVNWF